MLLRLAKFGLAGIANTVVGFGVIILLLAWGSGDYAANATGYAFGLTVSFLLNRRFTFDLKGSLRPSEALAFGACAMVAYIFNIFVLMLGRKVLGEGSILTQLAAVSIYTVIFFILTSQFVFNDRKS